MEKYKGFTITTSEGTQVVGIQRGSKALNECFYDVKEAKSFIDRNLTPEGRQLRKNATAQMREYEKELRTIEKMKTGLEKELNKIVTKLDKLGDVTPAIDWNDL